MTLIRPHIDETTTKFLQHLSRKFVLLNVLVNEVRTSVCVFKRRDGAASWRRKEENNPIPLNLDSPGFSVDPQTLALTFDDVNVLANNFHAIFEAIPWLAVDKKGGVAVGKLPSNGDEMGQLLTNLERLSKELLAIHSSLDLSLDTPSHELYRGVGHHAQLMNGNRLSEFGQTLLMAFNQSQATYAKLPLLRGFGTGNIRRMSRPEMRGALLRYYMKHKQANPLGITTPLDFVDYELKVLHISKKLNWTCLTDPRTESVDLLLSSNDNPVITEVKMAGDSFVSAAVVQLMYYASVMANNGQKARMSRQFGRSVSGEGSLCIIAEERDESKTRERGFGDDVRSAIAFLQHEQTRTVMSPYYRGASIVRIQELPEPFCRERGIPAFQVVNGGEIFVAWQ